MALPPDDPSVNPLVGSGILCGGGGLGDRVCGVCIDNDDLMLSRDGEPNEAAQPRALAAPSPPSRQEALEHYMTHLPFRNWCPFCVKGKSKASPHLVHGDRGEHEVPIVAFDYCFMSEHDKTPLRLMLSIRMTL